MTKYNVLTIKLIFFFSLLSGCRYEDGPAISFVSACKRIEGTYDVSKYTIGGYDSTSTLKALPCYGRITFNENEIYGNRDSLNCKFSGQYSLNDGKRTINILFFSNFPKMAPLGIPEVVKWDIKELRNNEMTFTTVYNGKECILQLKE